MTRPYVRFLDCAMDGCRCGQQHPVLADCPDCMGCGLVMAGDELQPCVRCALDYARIEPYVRQEDLTEDNSAKRGQRDAERWAIERFTHELGLD